MFLAPAGNGLVAKVRIPPGAFSPLIASNSMSQEGMADATPFQCP
jgi:hypothetical protein